MQRQGNGKLFWKWPKERYTELLMQSIIDQAMFRIDMAQGRKRILRPKENYSD